MSWPLEVNAEGQNGGIRVRFASCPCGKYHAILLGLEDKPLWLCVQAEGNRDVMPDLFSGWLAHMEDPEWVEIAEHGIWLYGAIWEKLPHSESFRQLVQFSSEPDWMDDIPLEVIRTTRGVVWGKDDITRTAVALAACRGSYNAGGVFKPDIVDQIRRS